MCRAHQGSRAHGFTKNENGVMRNAGADAAGEKPPPTDVEQRRGRERRGEEKGKKEEPVWCALQ